MTDLLTIAEALEARAAELRALHAAQQTGEELKPIDPVKALLPWCVSEWNEHRAAHWSTARRPRKDANLRARMKECGGMDSFRAAFTDRLERMVLAYGKPMDGGWTPSLRWLLEPNGWEKSAEKPRPGPKASSAPTEITLPAAEQRWRASEREAEANRASPEAISDIMKNLPWRNQG